MYCVHDRGTRRLTPCPVLFRDDLKRHYTLGEFWLEVEMEDLASFDEDMSDCLYKLPSDNLPLVSTSMRGLGTRAVVPKPVLRDHLSCMF